MSPVEKYLQLMAGFFEGREVKNIYTFILDHGRQFEFDPARKVRKMRLKQCFRNAAELALADSSLVYCEGYALSVVPVEHAWCVDAGGRVFDPTWVGMDGERNYFGVPFKRAFLERRLLSSGVYGLFSWPHNKWVAQLPKPELFVHPNFPSPAGHAGRRPSNKRFTRESDESLIIGAERRRREPPAAGRARDQHRGKP